MTTPQQQPAAPVASYTSPIPIRRAHLGDALASEWTKIRSVRSTMWTLGVMVLLMTVIGIGLAALVTAVGEPAPTDEPVLGLGVFGALTGSICVITLGALTVTSEFGTGMIRTTLTACPSRARVLAAKALVFFGLAFTAALVTVGLVALCQVAMVDGREPTGEEWLLGTVGVSLFIALLGLTSLGVGAVVRHSAGAITIMLGLMLLPLVAGFFMLGSSALQDVSEVLLEYSVPAQLIGVYGEAAGSGPAGWGAVATMLGIAAVALGSGFAAVGARDV
ncbi:ABC transporter permease [Streptomyces sanyensis]|uniref:ABC transporter permease n=1 Tax=Streptomyces sanyensis TaxID=568869 RepID=UPI003D77CFE5